MKQYKAIFLDWDDTIGDWSNAAWMALQELFIKYHLDELYDSVSDFFNTYEPYNLELWRKYGEQEVTKAQLHFERFYYPLMVNDYPEFRGVDKKLLARQMGDDFLALTNKHFSLLPDAAETVHYLASKYPLTIISNGFKEVQYYKFAHSGLASCFAHTLISEEVGVNKPQPDIFRLALKLNGVTPDEALMVGDSYSSDIAGAKAAEIDQVWIHQETTIETATYIIPHIADLKFLI
ncbi:MAG: YjjG family noncanonical pyrimidine nucleotidase [Paludibacteraceae bacterium]|nr:YjjG family noncanonical pyrimidine nucleotidase [Paludibacteraceae bacterium]